MARLTIINSLLQKNLAIKRIGPFNPLLIKLKLFEALNKNPNSNPTSNIFLVASGRVQANVPTIFYKKINGL
jgi:hypothetical protein